MPVGTSVVKEKKGHICLVGDAKHPSERWETGFVFVFITKFTNLRQKVEGFQGIQDFEEALLSPTRHPILMAILSKFILNLKPQTRNLNFDQVSSTITSILLEHMKGTERTVFWDSDQRKNVEPLQAVEGGIWGASWELKLRILRQLVEFQLSGQTEIKDIIDRAWGVVHNKHRKREGQTAPPDPSDPHSVESLSCMPIGQDKDRLRYWCLDDSPRIYVSTNPWKTSSTFKAVASTREQYQKVIDQLKAQAPKTKKESWTKNEAGHFTLIDALEARLPAIDDELARVAKIQRKLQQKEILRAQAELRSTRTRRQTRRPDYSYLQDNGSDEEGDEYAFQEDQDDEDHLPDDDEMEEFGGRTGRRRSQRSTTLKRQADANVWRGERRSTRLGFSGDGGFDGPSSKRARTEERSVSGAPSDSATTPTSQIDFSMPPRQGGAAAVKASEVAVEQVAGKKRSKFWYYAVEPVPSSAPQPDVPMDVPPRDSVYSHFQNGHVNGSGDAAPEGPFGNPNGDNGTNGHYVTPASQLVLH